MSKRRLPVLLEEKVRSVQRAARAGWMTVAEWVRQALRADQRRAPTADPRRKIESIRAAARHAFPCPDIDQMLAEIESGYFETGRS
ncbi:MAG TPA: antitoxin [Thermoanaerobaculia bacterium]|nr:antitoxin [Thermoanaerobaculia bacterium]